MSIEGMHNLLVFQRHHHQWVRLTEPGVLRAQAKASLQESMPARWFRLQYNESAMPHRQQARIPLRAHEQT